MWQFMSGFIDDLIEAIIGSQCFIVGTLVVVLPDHHVVDLVLKSLTITLKSCLCIEILEIGFRPEVSNSGFVLNNFQETYFENGCSKKKFLYN